MSFKTIENTSVANDILENLGTIHTKQRYSRYSLKGLYHAYTLLRQKTRHKFLSGFNNKELIFFMNSYNNYIKEDHEEVKSYQVLILNPTCIKDIIKIRSTWSKRKINGDNPLMDMEAIWVSKTEINDYLRKDHCVYLIKNKYVRIEKEIESIKELIPFELMTLREASERWGLGESTIRGLIGRSNNLRENIDYRKSGYAYLITEHAMRRCYGEPIKDAK